MINYGNHYIDKDDIKYVSKALKSKLITQGPLVERFEKKIKKYVQSKFCVSVNSATSALHIACLSLGLKKNELVWTTPTTFVSTANSALFCGAKVDFVDIDQNTFNISIIDLKRKLYLAKKIKKIPKILIIVHLAGLPVDIKEIYNLSKEYKFKIIEDASHALGAKYYNHKVGSGKWSHCTVFSFHPVKMITTGEGGAITTNNSKINEKLLILRNNGITKNKKNFKFKSRDPWYYEQQYLSHNYRLSDLNCALGISQLKKINKFLKKRHSIAKIYKKKLSMLNLEFQKIKKGFYSSYHLFIIKFKGANAKEKQLKVFKNLRKNKINAQLHYVPTHLHPYYRKLGFKKNQFKSSENYANSSLSIPIYYSLKFRDQMKVIKKIRQVLND